jgi:hypothetical protein
MSTTTLKSIHPTCQGTIVYELPELGTSELDAIRTRELERQNLIIIPNPDRRVFTHEDLESGFKMDPVVWATFKMSKKTTRRYDRETHQTKVDESVYGSRVHVQLPTECLIILKNAKCTRWWHLSLRDETKDTIFLQLGHKDDPIVFQMSLSRGGEIEELSGKGLKYKAKTSQTEASQDRNSYFFKKLCVNLKISE